MTTDFSRYSTAELQQLVIEVGQTIERRKVDDKKNLISELHALAAEKGFNLKDLLGGAEPGGKKKGASVAKYANPADKSQTWSGRGRKPVWALAHLNAGGSLDDLAV
ncbi:H-NS histone family protein [Silvimonas iriomotensis]|uniref:Trans-acting regulatory protein hvrA n=1 Tax=Silvimonas iriomotensis TaxID=449662 RepID=A0ABQ2P5S3_9NEIS|nr:H-NS histone family protein [Silvimonas iriomotensis]GGP18827.1 trans-acting regulatory protein hvrA [Silvimonas iriomotensis]